jgi:hypothetical protein
MDRRDEEPEVNPKELEAMTLALANDELRIRVQRRVGPMLWGVVPLILETTVRVLREIDRRDPMEPPSERMKERKPNATKKKARTSKEDATERRLADRSRTNRLR